MVDEGKLYGVCKVAVVMTKCGKSDTEGFSITQGQSTASWL